MGDINCAQPNRAGGADTAGGKAVLLHALDSATLSDEEAAEIIDMINRKQAISTVRRLHTNKIIERRDGRLYTSIGGGKKLISRQGESEDDFLFRLYQTHYAADVRPTLDSIFDDFFEAYKLGREDETWRNAEIYYRNHIQGSAIAAMPLSDITNADVDDYFDALSAKHVGQHPAKFYAKLRTVLNAMFRYASRKRLISYIPYSADFTEIATRFRQQTPPQTWTLKEYGALLAAIDDSDVYERCFHLQTLIGCRTSEILALRFEDVTTDQQGRPVVHIHAHNAVKVTKDADGSYHERFETVEGTKGRRRNGIHDVPLGEEAQRLIAISRAQCTAYLFEKPGQPGAPLVPNTYNMHVKKLCAAAGVKVLSNYAARRLVVSRLQTADNHYELMQVMGWANDNTASYATSINDTMYEKVANLGNPLIC